MAAELEQLRVSLVAELVGREAFEQLKREVNQVKAAIGGLDDVQKKSNKGIEASEKAIRQQRQAFAQGGMQINQFAGQIAAGTPVMTAFVQQIGDVAYVVGQAGESMGRVGRFLQGPWAAAILIGVSVLGPLIARLFETKKATEELEKTEKLKRETSLILRDAQLQYNESVAKTPEAQRKAIIAIIDAAKADYDATTTIVNNAKNRIKTIEAEIAAINERTRAQIISFTGGDGAAGARAGVVLKGLIQESNATGKLTEAKKKLAEVDKDRAQAFAGLKAAEARLVNFDQQIADSNARAAVRQEKALERAREKAKKLAKEQEIIALETRLIYAKGAQEFESSMKKMGDVAGKEIDKFLREDIKNSIAGMSNLFDAIKEQVDEVVYAGSDKVQGLAEAMGESFSAGIKGMITGAMNFKQVMSSVIDSVINKLFEMFVVQQIVGMIGKGISAVTGIPLKPKAIGGPVQAGGAYMVGERGPEMFVPSRSGSIVPNGGMSGMTINVDARGSADPGAVRAQVELGIAQAAPYIIAAAQNRTLKTAGRARLPGTIG